MPGKPGPAKVERRGGPRPGSGRPPGRKNNTTIAAQEAKALAREEFRKWIEPHMRELAEAQIAAARGIRYLVSRDKQTGKFEVLDEKKAKARLANHDPKREVIEMWAKSPSFQSYKDLADRYMDQPTQPIQHEGDLDVEMTVRWKEPGE